MSRSSIQSTNRPTISSHRPHHIRIAENIFLVFSFLTLNNPYVRNIPYYIRPDPSISSLPSHRILHLSLHTFSFCFQYSVLGFLFSLLIRLARFIQPILIFEPSISLCLSSLYIYKCVSLFYVERDWNYTNDDCVVRCCGWQKNTRGSFYPKKKNGIL